MFTNIVGCNTSAR